MKKRVFISFSKNDMPTVLRLRDSLSGQRYSPYVAADVVEPAQHISKKIENAISNSHAFIVLLTESSAMSPWVQQEIGYAKGRVPIVPIKAEGVRPPALLEGCDCVVLNEDNLSRIGSIVNDAIRAFVPPIGRNVCDEGPYEVGPGSYLDIPLDVTVGDHVTGRIEESDGEGFDWWILDERNLVKFKRGDDFKPARSEVDAGASSVNWRVKAPGPWFLALSLYGKKNARVVIVSLRRN